MSLTLHNTLSRQKEPFVPLDPENIRLYVCGPTVYDRAHLGNARPVVVFDVLFRLLQHLYPRVTYVRNITDVDDKIITAAKENGEPIDALTARTEAMFHADMAALNTLPPTHEPRATAYIGPMIALVEQLIEKGHAYAAEGHVLFAVESMPDYGQLSRRSRDELIAGARVEVAPYKRDPADFILWKPSTEDQPGWDSPWGYGRPGWHLECSAMSGALLGVPFDIHGGGLDLVFPHHENEIAQSRCAMGCESLARYWVHNGYLIVEGEKMSKSLGNFFTVHDLLAEWPGEVLRFSMLGTHYRQPLDFTRDGLQAAREGLDRLYNALRLAAESGEAFEGVEEPAGRLPEALLSALEDDLNTPAALAALYETARSLNKAKPAEKPQLYAELKGGGALLGILQQDPVTWLQSAGGEGAAEEGLDAATIEALIAERLAARKGKNFARADQIRDDLKAQGIMLEDSPQGTTWRRG